MAHPRVALLSSATATLSLIGGWTYAAALQPSAPSPFDPVRESISALASTGMPHRFVMTAALVVTGLAHVVTALSARGMSRPGRWLLAGAGLLTLGVAAVPLPAREHSSMQHTLVAAASFVALALWPLWARPRRLHRVGAVVLALAVASLLLSMSPTATMFGLHERVVAGLLAGWTFVHAAVTARGPRPSGGV